MSFSETPLRARKETFKPFARPIIASDTPPRVRGKTTSPLRDGAEREAPAHTIKACALFWL